MQERRLAELRVVQEPGAVRGLRTPASPEGLYCRTRQDRPDGIPGQVRSGPLSPLCAAPVRQRGHTLGDPAGNGSLESSPGRGSARAPEPSETSASNMRELDQPSPSVRVYVVKGKVGEVCVALRGRDFSSLWGPLGHVGPGEDGSSPGPPYSETGTPRGTAPLHVLRARGSVYLGALTIRLKGVRFRGR